MIDLLFFGKLSDLADNRSIELPDGVSDTAALINWLGEGDALLAEALAGPGIRIAVNAAMVRESHPVQDGDEIAVMSPMSGG